MYEYVLFDLDGTLTDPGLGITNSVIYALKKFDIAVTDRKELYKFIGPPLLNSFREYYGFSEKESVLAVEYFREYFSEKGIYENKVYEDIRKVLSELKEKNKKVIVATSKPEKFAVTILKHFQLDQYFDFVAG
ncbi:MAG: HAD hydrolase-like protein, partial [Hespellia sp.]|nr:HAD hydrolase-like protein [Hespellia sp.]